MLGLPLTHTRLLCCAVLCCADLGNRKRERNKPLRENNNKNRLHHTLCMQLSISLPVDFCTKKQETRNETERKREPYFFRTFLITPFQLFRQVQFPATKRREKEEKKNLQVDDQDGVRSSLARKSAGLSLHNNIIIGTTINEQTKTKTNCGHTHHLHIPESALSRC